MKFKTGTDPRLIAGLIGFCETVERIVAEHGERCKVARASVTVDLPKIGLLFAEPINHNFCMIPRDKRLKIYGFALRADRNPGGGARLTWYKDGRSSRWDPPAETGTFAGSYRPGGKLYTANDDPIIESMVAEWLRDQMRKKG